jgi:hypothetical protein
MIQKHNTNNTKQFKYKYTYYNTSIHIMVNEAQDLS